MNSPLRFTYRHLSPSTPLEETAQTKLEKLERKYGPIISCDVRIEGPSLHHKKGGDLTVSLDIAVPGREIAVTRTADATQVTEGAISVLRDAFTAAEKCLREHADRHETRRRDTV